MDIDIFKAAAKGNAKTVLSLVDGGADINAKDNDGQTALMKAAREGHVGIVELLLKKGADVNVKGQDGWTAQRWVAQKRHRYAQVVKLLEHFGAC